MRYTLLTILTLCMAAPAFAQVDPLPERKHDLLLEFSRPVTRPVADVEPCTRTMAGESYYNVTSAFFCFCRHAPDPPSWRQMHNPDSATGCGNR